MQLTYWMLAYSYSTLQEFLNLSMASHTSLLAKVFNNPLTVVLHILQYLHKLSGSMCLV